MLRETLRLGALMMGMCGLVLGHSLFGTLTALRMSEEGFDPTIIGIALSCHSIGFIITSVPSTANESFNTFVIPDALPPSQRSWRCSD